jgi:PAS domain-containing protein
MPQHSIHTLSPEDSIELVLDAPWGIAIVTTDFKFEWVNPAYCKILEAPADLIIGTTFGQWTHPDDLEIDLELATKVKHGTIPGYTLSKRYLKRLSTPQNPRIVCGMLSVAAKWQDNKLTHYRVHFQPFESTQVPASTIKVDVKEVAKWIRANWKAIATILVTLLSLTSIGSDRLLEILTKAKHTAESVDGALSPSQPGQPQQPRLP